MDACSLQEVTSQLRASKQQVTELTEELEERVTSATTCTEELKQERDDLKARLQQAERGTAAEQATSVQLRRRVQEQAADVAAMVALLDGNSPAATDHASCGPYDAMPPPSANVARTHAITPAPVSKQPMTTQRPYQPSPSPVQHRGSYCQGTHGMSTGQARQWRGDGHECGMDLSIHRNAQVLRGAGNSDFSLLSSSGYLTAPSSSFGPVQASRNRKASTASALSLPDSASLQAATCLRQEMGSLNQDLAEFQLSLSHARTSSGSL
jgi:hypothetical protein